MSLELNIDVFSLNNWLNISLVVNFFSRSGNILSSGSLLKNWFSHDRLSGLVLGFRFLEVDSFSIVNNLSLNNRLSINFLSRSLNGTVYGFFRELGWSGFHRSVVDLSLTSVNLELNVFGEDSWLNVLLSDSSFSWNIDRN